MQLSKVISLFLCSIFCLTAYSNIHNKIEQYYELVNKAEISICNGKLRDAYKEYTAAYQIQGDKMSSKHLYNYFAVSADLQEWDNCSQLLTELKKRGWQYHRYEQTINNHYLQSKEKMLPLYHKLNDVKSELDSNLLQKIKIMVDFDQATNEYFRSINKGELGLVGMDTLDKITELHLVALQYLFSKKFPTDKVLGREEHPWGHLPYSVILIHNTQGSNFHYLDDTFYEAVVKGDFAPEEFDQFLSLPYYGQATKGTVAMADQQVQVPLFPHEFIVYHDSLFEIPFPAEKTAAYDEQRKKIPGLCSVKELRQKIIFQYYNSKYHFVSDRYITTINLQMPPRIISRYVYTANINK